MAGRGVKGSGRNASSLQHLQGKAIGALRQGGASVEVGGFNLQDTGFDMQV